jgi:hypothetical protein
MARVTSWPSRSDFRRCGKARSRVDCSVERIVPEMRVRRACDHDGMGRPSKLTGDRKSAILEALRAGNDLETAAARVGIHWDTLNG